ncbi:hypothetical protein F2Q69_00011128 [Brassica cretica]|uniref:Uncharacterized protein n=1 Tax=Brassica cretica TaxID=69181 RepID=A0A8S9QWK1_BRACR|nr:hypothetical protein F2Q69_00011128 [Brassica cretica]
MIGYDWTEAKFFWFYNYMLASLILCDLDTKLSDLRNLHVFLPQSIWNLFSGSSYQRLVKIMNQLIGENAANIDMVEMILITRQHQWLDIVWKHHISSRRPRFDRAFNSAEHWSRRYGSKKVAQRWIRVRIKLLTSYSCSSHRVDIAVCLRLRLLYQAPQLPKKVKNL